MNRRPKGKFFLVEPFDFKALEEAYRKAGCKWSTGYRRGYIPSSEQIEEHFLSLKKYAVEDTGYCSSGGITVRADSGSFTVEINFKLAAHMTSEQIKVVTSDKCGGDK